MSSLGIGSKQALQILKKGYDSVSGIVLQAVPPKKVTIEQILDPIEKDLDVLEILRPHLINAGIGKYDDVSDYELLHLKLSLSGKEYNKIKEWLENGKKQL